MSMIYNYGYKTHDDFNTITPIIKKHLTTQLIHNLDNHIIKTLINIIDLGIGYSPLTTNNTNTYDYIINNTRNKYNNYIELLPPKVQTITLLTTKIPNKDYSLIFYPGGNSHYHKILTTILSSYHYADNVDPDPHVHTEEWESRKQDWKIFEQAYYHNKTDSWELPLTELLNTALSHSKERIIHTLNTGENSYNNPQYRITNILKNNISDYMFHNNLTPLLPSELDYWVNSYVNNAYNSLYFTLNYPLTTITPQLLDKEYSPHENQSFPQTTIVNIVNMLTL